MIKNDTTAIFSFNLLKKRPVLKFSVPVLMIVTAMVLLSLTTAVTHSSADGTGEDAPIIDWAKSFGGHDSDTFTSVIAVSDGYVAVGYSFADSFGDDDWDGVTAKGKNDATIVKFDTNGDVVWAKNFGGDDNDYFYSVTADGSGYVAVGESAYESFGSGDLAAIAGKGEYDAIAVKFNLNGDIVWMKNFGGEGYDVFKSVTAAGNGYVAVGFSSLDSFGNGDWNDIDGRGLQDAIIVKYDVSGNVTWKKNFGGEDNDVFLSVAADSSGYVAAGFSNSTSFGNGDWNDIDGRGGQDAIIVKYDVNGNKVWAKNFGGEDDDFFESVTADSSGYVAAGASSVYSFNSGDWIGIAEKGGYDATIVKFSKSGDVDWAKSFGGIGDDYFNSVITDGNGYVAAGSSGPTSFGSGDWTGVAGKGEEDAMMVKYDTDGSVVWKINIGGSSLDNFFSVTADSSGYVAVGCSYIDSFGNGDWTGVAGNGADDATIMKYVAEEAEPTEPTEPGSSGSNMMIWIGIVAVVIISTVVAVFVMIRYKTP